MMTSLIYNTEFIISFLLSIIGIILSVYFYQKGRKFRQISYTYKTTYIAPKDTSLKKLSLLYNGEELDSLSITDLIIWSNGRELINNSDIAPMSPLAIHSSSKMIDYQIICFNEPNNNFQFITSNNNLTIYFDYMSRNDGIAIRIIHTGNCDNISVTCKIKDGKETMYVGQRKGYFYSILNNKCVKYILSRKFTSFMLIVFTVFLFPIAFIQSANYADNNYFGLPSDNIFMNLDSIVIFILCACSFLLSIPHISNLFKTEPPDNLLKCTSCER